MFGLVERQYYVFASMLFVKSNLQCRRYFVYFIKSTLNELLTFPNPRINTFNPSTQLLVSNKSSILS